MEYKVLVLDLDGTLTNSKKEIPKRNKELIIKAQQKGVIVVLASGRPMYGVAPLAKALELDLFGGYVLAFNGGKTIDFKNKKVIQEQIIDPDMLPSLYASAKAYGMELISYEDDFILTENPDNIYVQKESFLNKMPTQKVDNLVEYINFNVPKCLMVGDAERMTGIEPEMREKYGDRLNIFRSEPYFLEIMPLGIDKAQSLQTLLEYLRMSREEMIAVGDGFNDLTMIRYAGMGVAMANAQQVVKDVAGYITLSNEDDGVAHVVEKFLL